MINIAELLKYCPKGMELDCTMFDGVTLHSVNIGSSYPIVIAYQAGEDRCTAELTEYGCWNHSPSAKCVIFPKGKTTWGGFVPPPCEFKDGDVVATMSGSWLGITKGGKEKYFIPTYCIIKANGEFEAYFDKKEKWKFDRLAAEEEKQKLFDAIKANGYKWNAETKALERSIESKFDITTLKPFESRVLVRDKNSEPWVGQFFSHFDASSDKPFVCIGTPGLSEYKQCIPYEGNEHLLNTSGKL